MRLTLKQWDRNTTKGQYKSISRWLRTASKIVEAKTQKHMQELLCFGSTVIGDDRINLNSQKDRIYGKSPGNSLFKKIKRFTLPQEPLKQ